MKEYIANRKTEPVLKYGLWRITEAVIQEFQDFDLPESCIVLDVGTADGLLLCSPLKYCNQIICGERSIN
jgi:hypothetical protein